MGLSFATRPTPRPQPRAGRLGNRTTHFSYSYLQVAKQPTALAAHFLHLPFPDWHAAVLLGRSSGWMNIGQPLTRRRLLVGARLAIRRASFAISDCWQSPQLRGGLDHTPFSRRCSNISQNGPCTEHSRLSCSSRLSAAPQLRARKWYLSQI